VFWLHFSIAQVSQDGEGNSHRFLLVMIRTLFHCTQHAILLWWLLRVLVQKAPFELGVSLVAGKEVIAPLVQNLVINVQFHTKALKS
jgi:hypothetical protein